MEEASRASNGRSFQVVALLQFHLNDEQRKYRKMFELQNSIPLKADPVNLELPNFSQSLKLKLIIIR